MNRFVLRLGISLMTFGVGVGAAWGALYASLPAPSATESAPSEARSSTGGIEISLEQTFRAEGGKIIAEFLVVNGGAVPVYYEGYTKHDNQHWSVMRGGETERHAPHCGTGLAERKLSPGESVKFRADVGAKAGSLRLGFDFSTGVKRPRRTTWGGEIHIPES